MRDEEGARLLAVGDGAADEPAPAEAQAAEKGLWREAAPRGREGREGPAARCAAVAWYAAVVAFGAVLALLFVWLAKQAIVAVRAPALPERDAVADLLVADALKGAGGAELAGRPDELHELYQRVAAAGPAASRDHGSGLPAVGATGLNVSSGGTNASGRGSDGGWDSGSDAPATTVPATTASKVAASGTAASDLAAYAREVAAPRTLSRLPRTSSHEYNMLRSGEKYLLYSPSGGWANQLHCLVNAIEVARRNKRTLIVPMHGRHSNLYRGYLRLRPEELVPMDQVIDFAEVERHFDVRLLPLNVTLNQFEGSVRARDRGYVFMPPEGLRHPLDPNVFSHILSAVRRSSRQVLYLKGRWYNKHYAAADAVSRVRVAPYLYSVAATAADAIAAIGAGHFNSMHIRLGDYRDHAAKAGTSFVASADRLRFNRSVPLYVAAEERRSDPYFEPLLAHFDRVLFAEDLVREPTVYPLLLDFVRSTPNGTVRNGIFGLVEQLILARSDNFIGTRVSTWSKVVYGMRDNLAVAAPDFFQRLVAERAAKGEAYGPRTSALATTRAMTRRVRKDLLRTG